MLAQVQRLIGRCLVALLTTVLDRCAEKGLKLNPAKCSFYQKEALWCGRIVSSRTVSRHCRPYPNQSPGRICNNSFALWAECVQRSLRTTPVQPLVDLLEAVYARAGGRTKRKAAKVPLLNVGWPDVHTASVAKVKQALAQVVALSHPDPAQQLCVFDADATFDALIEWFATLGVCDVWVSYQGTHFRNEVIESLRHALDAHRSVPLGKSHRRVGKQGAAPLCSEVVVRMAAPVLPVVQIALNQTPSPRCYATPLEVMTGLSPRDGLDAVLQPATVPATTTSLADIVAAREKEFTALKQALVSPHKTVADTRAARRAQGRRKAAVVDKTAQFAIGDYVLYADVWARPTHKLQLKWCGLAAVVGAVSNWIFGSASSSRARSARSTPVVSSSTRTHPSMSLAIFKSTSPTIAKGIDHLVACRYDEKARRYELKVRWRRLAKAEDSWEPAVNVWADLPATVRAYTRQSAEDPAVTKMTDVSVGQFRWGEVLNQLVRSGYDRR